MKIGIFSKFESTGGSEFRCIEMANSILKNTNHQPIIFAEGDMVDKVKAKINNDITVYSNLFLPNPNNVEKLYELDCLLTVNTDSKEFCSLDYWFGKSYRHGVKIDLTQIKKMVFLFNFIISPSRGLFELEPYCKDIRIITTNKKFFDEVSDQDRYDLVRHFPRTILESPIDPESITTDKNESSKIRFGMHSKPVEDKWNNDYKILIERCNKRLGEENIEWYFMGMPKNMRNELQKHPNVIALEEFSLPVKDFLKNVDVFTFFTSYSREEAWARSVAEAIMSGCPVIGNNRGGNKDQILHGNNGFLCKSFDDFMKYCVYFAEHKEKLEKMKFNSLRLAKTFTSQRIINKFLEFIE